MKNKSFRNLIKEHSFFRCTFKKVRAKGKVFKKETVFYFIGVLPIIITDKDGKKEVSNLNAYVDAKGKAVMKHIQGLKYKDKLVQSNYRDEAKKVVNLLATNYLKCLKDKRIGDKDIEKLTILSVKNATTNKK